MSLRTRIALVCMVGACSEQDANLSSVDQAVAVTFQNAIGVTVTGNSLTKTAANGWGNAGASSVQTIGGDGFVEFTTAETNRTKIAGLSNGDTNQTDADVDFGFVPATLGRLNIREAGIDLGQFG